MKEMAQNLREIYEEGEFSLLKIASQKHLFEKIITKEQEITSILRQR